MSDQPVPDLLGGDNAPPANPFGSTNGSETKTGTSHDANGTPNGAATADGYSFAPPPETPSAPSLAEAPETPSEKLSRGFNKLGGALGGLGKVGATVGRGIHTASSRATSAVARTSERIDAVGSPEKREMANGNAGNAGAASGISNAGERKGPMMNIAMQRTLSGVGPSSAASTSNKKQQTAQTHSAPNSGNSTGGGFSLGSSFAALTTTMADGLSSTTTALTQSLTTNLTRQYTMPDRTVASQVLMYRQLLHTECKPGLRLSRAFQGTPAQRAVMHMPVSFPMRVSYLGCGLCFKYAIRLCACWI